MNHVNDMVSKIRIAYIGAVPGSGHGSIFIRATFAKPADRLYSQTTGGQYD